MSDKVNAPFLRNAWYQAAWDYELQDGLLARTLLNEPLLFFRDASGQVGCVEDRCCHRGAPLSHGKIVEAGLQCGYHGLVFDVNGKCVEIPGQDSIPPMAKVKSHPVVERQGFIWVWMGDPALADKAKIIDWDYHDDEKYPRRVDVKLLKINYMMMIDNLMDLTHLGFVHTKTIGGNPMAHVLAKMDSERTDTGARLSRWMPDIPPPPTFVKGADFKGRIDRWQEFEYIIPGTVKQWSGALEVGRGASENRNQDGVHLLLMHTVTPQTENTAYYFWSFVNGCRNNSEALTDEVNADVLATFQEDFDIMEAQQRRLDADPDRSLVPIRSDSALVHARRAFQTALDRERAAMPQAAE